MGKVDFDNYIKEYDKLLNENLSFFSKDDSYFAEYKIELMKKYTEIKPKKILEYGCGLGRNFSFLKESFKDSEIYGYDVAKKSLDYAILKNPYVKKIDNVKKIKEKFDIVFCSVVYHHIDVKDREEVTYDIFNSLNKNGEMFVFEHNPYNIVTKKLVERCVYDEDAVLISSKKMKNMMKRTGFTDFNLKYYLYFPPFLKIKKLEKYISFLPLGGQYMLRGIKK